MCSTSSRVSKGYGRTGTCAPSPRRYACRRWRHRLGWQLIRIRTAAFGPTVAPNQAWFVGSGVEIRMPRVHRAYDAADASRTERYGENDPAQAEPVCSEVITDYYCGTMLACRATSCQCPRCLIHMPVKRRCSVLPAFGIFPPHTTVSLPAAITVSP